MIQLIQDLPLFSYPLLQFSLIDPYSSVIGLNLKITPDFQLIGSLDLSFDLITEQISQKIENYNEPYHLNCYYPYYFLLQISISSRFVFIPNHPFLLPATTTNSYLLYHTYPQFKSYSIIPSIAYAPPKNDVYHATKSHAAPQNTFLTSETHIPISILIYSPFFILLGLSISNSLFRYNINIKNPYSI